MRVVRGYVGTAMGLALTALFGSLAVLAYLPFGQRGVLWCARTWGRWVLRAGRVLVAVRGGEQIQAGQPYIYVSNHQSGLDILVLIGHLPGYVRFVAKRELARVPFVGWALRLAGHVLIDRADRHQSFHALKDAGREVREGKSVIIFPEGTRSTPRQLRPFKRGVVLLARAAQVPVVPVGIVGSADRMRAREIYTRPGLVGLRIGAPIPPQDWDADDRAFAEQLRQAVAQLAGPSAADVVGTGRARSEAARDAATEAAGAVDETLTASAAASPADPP